jgi:uncharacterized tellurite resistance protein B-like protein
VTDDQFEDAIFEAISGRATLTLPADPKERLEMVKDLLRVMAADGRMTDSEKELFALASTALGMDENDLNRLIDDVLAEGP